MSLRDLWRSPPTTEERNRHNQIKMPMHTEEAREGGDPNNYEEGDTIYDLTADDVVSGVKYRGGSRESRRLVYRCPTLFNCIDITARGMSQLRFKTEDASAQRLLDKPNMQETSNEFYYGITFDMLSTGHAFVEPQPQNNGGMMPDELLLLNPSKVIIKQVDEKLSINDYEYETRKGLEKLYDVIWFKDVFRTGLLWQGRADIVKDLALALVASNKSIRKDFDTPSHNIFNVSTEGNTRIDPDEEEAITEMLSRALKSKSGRGVVFTDGGKKIELMDVVMAGDANMRAMRLNLISELASIFSIPPFMVGGAGDTKYNNISARLVSMYRELWGPLSRVIETRLSQALEVEIHADIEEIVRGDVVSMINAAVVASGGPVLTPNEVRDAMLGRETLGTEYDSLRDVSSPTISIGDDRRGEMPTDDGDLDDLPEEQ